MGKTTTLDSSLLKDSSLGGTAFKYVVTVYINRICTSGAGTAVASTFSASNSLRLPAIGVCPQNYLGFRELLTMLL